MDWSSLPPIIRFLFVAIGVAAVVLVIAALQVNRTYYVLQAFGAVNGGRRKTAGRVTVGLITRPGRRFSLRGVTVHAEKYVYRDQEFRFGGTWPLSERQISHSLRVLRDRSEEPMFWGPRDRVRCIFREQGGEMVLGLRGLFGGYLDVPLPVGADAVATLTSAFEQLQKAPSRTIIEA